MKNVLIISKRLMIWDILFHSTLERAHGAHTKMKPRILHGFHEIVRHIFVILVI